MIYYCVIFPLTNTSDYKIEHVLILFVKPVEDVEGLEGVIIVASDGLVHVHVVALVRQSLGQVAEDVVCQELSRGGVFDEMVRYRIHHVSYC